MDTINFALTVFLKKDGTSVLTHFQIEIQIETLCSSSQTEDAKNL